jgi:hypothetical protein
MGVPIQLSQRFLDDLDLACASSGGGELPSKFLEELELAFASARQDDRVRGPTISAACQEAVGDIGDKVVACCDASFKVELMG